MAVSKAVFLDKDGTLIVDLPYNVDPGAVEFLPHAWEGLTLMQESGYKLVIVTNQSGPARGYCTENELVRLGAFFSLQFRRHGLVLSGFYFCPHLPAGVVADYSISCSCRKPRPGLLLRAAREQDIDLGASWCIGNMPSDTDAGRAAGCRTILLGKKGTHTGDPERGAAALTARDLEEAARIVVASAHPVSR